MPNLSDIVKPKLLTMAKEKGANAISSKLQTDIQALLGEIDQCYEDDPEDTMCILSKMVEYIDKQNAYVKNLALGIMTTLFFLTVTRKIDFYQASVLFLLFVIASVVSSNFLFEYPLSTVRNILAAEEQDKFGVTLQFLETGYRPAQTSAQRRELRMRDPAKYEIAVDQDVRQIRKLFVLRVVQALQEAAVELNQCERQSPGMRK